MNMVEIINNLQRDLQSHKYYNERIIISKEQQEEFNMKLMQSLNIIENKLDKKSGSRKSRSHMPTDEKIR